MKDKRWLKYPSRKNKNNKKKRKSEELEGQSQHIISASP
jgi:hypothetical protein